MNRKRQERWLHAVLGSVAFTRYESKCLRTNIVTQVKYLLSEGEDRNVVAHF